MKTRSELMWLVHIRNVEVMNKMIIRRTSGTKERMNGVLGHNSALYGYTGPETTWANGMNFLMKHAPGAGLLARPVDLLRYTSVVQYWMFACCTMTRSKLFHRIVAVYTGPMDAEGKNYFGPFSAKTFDFTQNCSKPMRLEWVSSWGIKDVSEVSRSFNNMEYGQWKKRIPLTGLP